MFAKVLECSGPSSYCFLVLILLSKTIKRSKIFLGSKITADGDYSREIKRCLLLGRKVMTNLDSIFKSRDITLSTKVRLVKAMVFPVVMCGCESWLKAQHSENEDHGIRSHHFMGNR